MTSAASAPDSPGSTNPLTAVSSIDGAFTELSRADWAALADHTDIEIDDETLNRLRGLGDPTSQQDVVEVYVPLTQLLHLHIRHTGHLYRASNAFLDRATQRTPFVIAIAGSVAVGKSTTARLLRELLSRSPGRPRVDLITTDGFLLPNDVLTERGLLERKGFPESYDRRALLQFVIDVKSGRPEVRVPVYSHLIYDIVEGEHVTVSQPDILIIEGLNVLQPARLSAEGRGGLAVSDFVDFSVYVDADDDDIENWFLDRFRRLRDSAFQDPDSFFRQFAHLSDDEATAMALQVWREINGPNLDENIRPTRERATAILHKGADHSVESVRVRKI